MLRWRGITTDIGRRCRRRSSPSSTPNGLCGRRNDLNILPRESRQAPGGPGNLLRLRRDLFFSEDLVDNTHIHDAQESEIEDPLRKEGMESIHLHAESLLLDHDFGDAELGKWDQGGQK